jgi:hypothetical protein
MKRLLAIALVSLAAASAFGQKGPLDQLGFHPEKLYDFSNTDSVSLFNGNLIVSVPIGIRYPVSSTLSYQLSLVFNGKVVDEETWCEPYFEPSNSECTGLNIRKRTYPNLRSNAGNGWRVSLGRLLAPVDTTLLQDTLNDPSWVYEGPSGDEHALTDPGSLTTFKGNTLAGLRMREVDSQTREIEFGSGEIHQFILEHSLWRLKQIRDRFGNHVDISYTYLQNCSATLSAEELAACKASPDYEREGSWSITDSAGRHHSVSMVNYASMDAGWSRGQQVSSIDLEGLGGRRAVYSFAYTTANTPVANVPNLVSVTQPDLTQYSFAGTLDKITYPTGGTVSYTYDDYHFAPQDSVCATATSRGVVSRSIADGSTSRIWNYLQEMGLGVPATANLTDPCGTNDNRLNGPFYWARTSVVAPLAADNHRTRTDHYFSIFADMLTDGNGAGGLEFQTTTRLPGQGVQKYGHSGVIGVPPPSARRKAVVWGSYSVGGEIDASDDPAHPDRLRLLATEIYADCDYTGDCTNGTLLRSTNDRYTGDVIPAPQPPGTGRATDTVRLLSSRTVYNDDAHCGSGTETCFRQVTYGDDNGADQFRKTTAESNFPHAQTVTTTVQYPTWSAADLSNDSKLWLLGTYSEKTRSEGGVTARETFCFDNAGALTRHRVLAGAVAGPNDLLQVFSYDTHGNVQFASDYGADVQTLDTGSDICSIALPSQPRYQVENTYTAGVPATSRYYDRTSGSPLGFFSFDRTIDSSTGAVTASRDTAGVATLYSYYPTSSNRLPWPALPPRLDSVTSPATAVTTYTYTSATGSAGASFTPAKVASATNAASGTLASQFVFDGLGRLVRSSALGPNGWNATETTFDEEGRTATRSEPESTGNAPPSGSLVAAYKTLYKYDALGRTKTITAPDNSTTTFDYVGDRQKTRTSSIWTGSAQPVSVTEQYDGSGRLASVTEKSGPTSATSVTGGDVTTSYSYDVAGRLSSVKMDGSARVGGTIQNRIFDYDGRGLLRWESQPESGMTSYTYDARGHVISKIQSAANSQFDLNYSYDSAERITRIDGRNPFYPGGNQTEFRVLKEFVYGTDNGSVQKGGSTVTDFRKGKLVTAIRHNYGETSSEAEYDIQDTYQYADVAGRKTDRATTITKIFGGGATALPELGMSVAYDDLDQQTTLKYPMCVGCGAPPQDPDRSLMTRGYTGGRLTSLSRPGSPSTINIATITYWPNGLRNVVTHANSIVDTQTVTDMPRPSQLEFATYDRCVRPAFVIQPASAPVSGGSATLSVTVSGTGPFTYEWYDLSQPAGPIRSQAGVTATTDSITVSPTTTTSYYVTVSNPCGFEQSQTAQVAVNACPTPATGVIQAVAQPDGTWILTPNPVARQGCTYSWERLSPDAATLGSSKTQAVGQLSATTTYRLTITDACGSATGQVTINVPLPITTGLQATWSSSLGQVSLTWPAMAGNPQYTVERRSLGGGWEFVNTTAGTTYPDTTVAALRTYVYRVTASNGGRTDYDVATTMTFVQAVPRQLVTATPMNSMLDAVNKVRAAAGWPAVTWSNILAANDPVPEPGQLITARQVMACRARMNEALQALGVRVGDYTDPDLVRLSIKADYINEVERRAQ